MAQAAVILRRRVIVMTPQSMRRTSRFRGSLQVEEEEVAAAAAVEAAPRRPAPMEVRVTAVPSAAVAASLARRVR
jgi:hypothetical protein